MTLKDFALEPCINASQHCSQVQIAMTQQQLDNSAQLGTPQRAKCACRQ